MESLGTGARVAALEERRKRVLDRKRLLMAGRRRWLLMPRKRKGKGYDGEI